jgi:hypothetical protein
VPWLNYRQNPRIFQAKSSEIFARGRQPDFAPPAFFDRPFFELRLEFLKKGFQFAIL